jgi:hypothetical protein
MARLPDDSWAAAAQAAVLVRAARLPTERGCAGSGGQLVPADTLRERLARARTTRSHGPVTLRPQFGFLKRPVCTGSSVYSG